MWAFEGFPAILRYQRENDDDAPTYEVEVFGYVNIDCFDLKQRQLLAFRECSYWIGDAPTYAGHDEIGQVQFMLENEFVKKFRKFKLV